MVTCAVSSCKRRSDAANSQQDRVSYHRFPKDPYLKEKWRKFCNESDSWIPTRTSVVCSEHFTSKCYHLHLNRRILIPGAIPSVRLCPCLTQQKQKHPKPAASAGHSACNISLNPDSFGLKVSAPEDPERQHDRPQDRCRFCAEYSKDCVDVTNQDRPYLTRNKTTLTINDLTVKLDFNNDALPKTVCGICDRKLQAMCDFFKQVKVAQESLIQVNVKEEIETVIVKMEREPTDNEDEDEDDADSKDDIVDSLTVTKTVVVKPYCNKRKSVKATPGTQKKRKIKEAKDIKSEESELIIDIKEEAPEYEAENPENDTETDIKPSVSELAGSVLVNEMSESETFG